MEIQKYTVIRNPNRDKENFVYNTKKDFVAGIEKTYRDATGTAYTYCVFPLYDGTYNMVLDNDYDRWAASKRITIKGLEKLAFWYLKNHLNYKEVNFTLMISTGMKYGTEYKEINFTSDVYEFSKN